MGRPNAARRKVSAKPKKRRNGHMLAAKNHKFAASIILNIIENIVDPQEANTQEDNGIWKNYLLQPVKSETIKYPYFDDLSNFTLDVLPEADTNKLDVAYIFVDPGGMTHYIHNLYVYDAAPSSQTPTIVKCIQTFCPSRAVILNNKFNLTVNHNHRTDIMDVLMAKLATLLKNRSAREPNLTVEEIIGQELKKYDGLEEYIINNIHILKEEMNAARGIEPVFDPYVYSLKFGTTPGKLDAGENDVVKIEDIVLLLKEAKCLCRTTLTSDIIKTEPIEIYPIATTTEENPSNIQTKDCNKTKSKKSLILNPAAITDQVATIIQQASNLENPRQENQPAQFTECVLQNMITFYSVNNRVPEIVTAIKHCVFNPESAKSSKVSSSVEYSASIPYGTIPGLSNLEINFNDVQVKTESEKIAEDEYHGIITLQEIISKIKMEQDNNCIEDNSFDSAVIL